MRIITKHINVIWGKSAYFLYVTAGGTCSYYGASGG